MAGRHRTRTGEPKPLCAMIVKDTACKTIPGKGWRYCPPHHIVIARQLASQWEQDLDWHQGTTIDVRLPDLGKPLQDLDIHERAALAQLILWQHFELELPPAPSQYGDGAPSESPAHAFAEM